MNDKFVALHGAGVHCLFEDRVAGLARMLGLVHGQIGITQEFCRELLVAPAYGDAEASSDKELAPTKDEGGPQFLQDTLSYAAGTVGVGILEEKDELVTSEACHRVLGPEVISYPLAHQLQQPIARLMSETIVYNLEVVQIHEHDRDGLLMTLGARECTSEAVREQDTVGQLSQGIMQGLVGELLLESLAFGDVAANE